MEMMGALTVRLIHDLSNHLTILAGNAQVLELVRDNPERLAKVIERIKTSTTHAGELLDRFARLRQELRFRSAPQLLTGCLGELKNLNPLAAGWRVESGGGLEGRVALEPCWVAFAVWQVALLSGAPQGRVLLTEGDFPADWPSPAYVPSRLREKRLFRCELAWAGPGPWLTEKEAAKPMDLQLAIAYELFKIIDGWAHYQFLPGDQHRFNLFFPVAT
jgi:signal transduction histidine kinase